MALERPNTFPTHWHQVLSPRFNRNDSVVMFALHLLLAVFSLSEKLRSFASASKARIILHYSHLCTLIFKKTWTRISHLLWRKRYSKSLCWQGGKFSNSIFSVVGHVEIIGGLTMLVAQWPFICSRSTSSSVLTSIWRLYSEAALYKSIGVFSYLLSLFGSCWSRIHGIHGAIQAVSDRSTSWQSWTPGNDNFVGLWTTLILNIFMCILLKLSIVTTSELRKKLLRSTEILSPEDLPN